MFFASLALLIFLSLGGLLFLQGYFRSVSIGRPDRARQDQFSLADVCLALLLAALLLNNAWVGFHSAQVTLTTAMVAASMILSFLIIIMICGVLIGLGRNPLTVFGLHWSGWRRELPYCWLALLAVYPILLTVQLLIQHLVPNVTAQDVLEFLKSSSSWKDRVLVIVTAIICAPIAEEIIFRGYLYGVGRQYLGRRVSIFLSALIFALIHAHLPSLPGLFIFAVFLTLVYEKTGSLWASMTLHATFNVVTIVLTLLWPKMV